MTEIKGVGGIHYNVLVACHVNACKVLIYAQALICITLSLLIMSPYMSAQYYGIENRTVAPYGYTENGEAFNLNEPPLLHVLVEQNEEFGFDAATREVFLSVTTHTCEL